MEWKKIEMKLEETIIEMKDKKKNRKRGDEHFYN